MNAALAPASPSTVQDAQPFTRVPQVNLLPPDVAAAHGLRAVKRWALLALALVVLAVGLVYAMSSFELAQARSDLVTAQDQTARLTAEQAQYSEVPVVLGELTDVRSTRQLATSTEVLWKPYIEAIRAALPEGGELSGLQVSGATPVLLATGPADVLASQAMGQIILTATTPTVPNAADWTDALSAVGGLIDARVQTVTQEGGSEAGPGGYTVTMTMQYDETALSGRFAATEED
ncbi:MAG: fimbrial assembly protein [Cellulomonas sp.]|uniref:fimbrial assembly protein n=1 Tax=Cellulomonas sp. TaxID=40001 RepID=UPI0019D852D6|nr:fimbrial assembly protein [Cellulomonas sp.]MBF0687598.1 fimbrial assembly protein [Cellulomonas sp.]